MLEGFGDAVAVLFCNGLDRRKYRKVQGLVTDAQRCILLLNEYFSQVMLTGDSTLAIPPEVIALFGHEQFLNCERLTRNPALVPMLGSVEFAKALFPIAQLHQAGYWGGHNAAYGRLCEFLISLWTVVLTLAKAPILVETGQYRPRLQNRTYQDMENQIARDLTNAPNFTAKVKLLSGEHTIRTKLAPETLSSDALAERIQAIRRHMQTLGYTRHYSEVEREIRERALRLLGITDDPLPATSNGHIRPAQGSITDMPTDADVPPPPGSFSLD